MRRSLKAIAIALTALPGVAHAAQPPCLTAAEFTGVASYALPSVISGTALRCSNPLPASSYLRSNSSQLATRYAAGGRTSIPPERLLRASLLQVVYSVRSERLLME